MPQMIDVTPRSLLGIVGAELFTLRICELALKHTSKRDFIRALEREIMPAVRAAFPDAQVARDVLAACRRIYGTRGEALGAGTRAPKVSGVFDAREPREVSSAPKGSGGQVARIPVLKI